MPAIQILPPNPSFGSQLGAALGSGAGQGISQALSQHFEMKQKQQQTNQLLAALGISPEQASQQSAEIPTQGQPATRTQQALGQEPKGLDLTPEKVLAVTMMNPALGASLSTLYQAQQKERGKEKERAEVMDTAQNAFNEMSSLLKKGNLGFGAKYKAKIPGEKGAKVAEAVGEFESLSGALESVLVDMVSRGTLSNSRFKYITETLLPKPDDREATIKGKLRGLAKELKLDPSALLGKSEESPKEAGGFVRMKDPSGVIRTIPKEKALAAQKAGGVLVK